MGQRWPIVCLHLEPVMIFAVPIILHFLIEENTTFNEEMFAHSLYCSYYKERENVYCKIISEYIYCWK